MVVESIIAGVGAVGGILETVGVGDVGFADPIHEGVQSPFASSLAMQSQENELAAAQIESETIILGLAIGGALLVLIALILVKK